MSATILLIMTSSSTRNTEPPGGRVAVMMESLPVPASGSQITPFGAMSTCGNTHSGGRRCSQLSHIRPGLIALSFNDKVTDGFHVGNIELKELFLESAMGIAR